MGLANVLMISIYYYSSDLRWPYDTKESSLELHCLA